MNLDAQEEPRKRRQKVKDALDLWKEGKDREDVGDGIGESNRNFLVPVFKDDEDIYA